MPASNICHLPFKASQMSTVLSRCWSLTSYALPTPPDYHTDFCPLQTLLACVSLVPSMFPEACFSPGTLLVHVQSVWLWNTPSILFFPSAWVWPSRRYCIPCRSFFPSLPLPHPPLWLFLLGTRRVKSWGPPSPSPLYRQMTPPFPATILWLK